MIDDLVDEPEDDSDLEERIIFFTVNKNDGNGHYRLLKNTEGRRRLY